MKFHYLILVPDIKFIKPHISESLNFSVAIQPQDQPVNSAKTSKQMIRMTMEVSTSIIKSVYC